MTVWKWVISSIIILVIGWGLYSLISAKNQLSEQATSLSAQASGLMKENNEFSNQTEYLKSDVNQLKLLKGQTSYRPADEKMFIITSGSASTSNTSTKK